MPTSGTTSFTMSFNDIMEEAFARAGIEPRTGFHLRTMRTSLNLMLIEWVSRGMNLWTVDQQVLNLVAGTATYTLPSDTVDVLDAVIRTNAGNVQLQFDQFIPRMSFTTYLALPSKQTLGRPIEYWVNRAQAGPTVTFWQTPDATQPYAFVYFRLRQMQDVGTVDNTQDVPTRFLPALTAGLAYYVSLKLAPERVEMLKAMYDEAWQNAADEDRERATFRWVPRLS